MNVPPDFGGTEIEEGVIEDLGVPRPEQRSLAENEEFELPRDDNEAHAPGQVCGLCGAVITAGQNVRHRIDGSWVHDVCPPVGLGDAGEVGPLT